ncbi:MAG: 3-hydroxyacyl-CoA dehydrogenase family protein, partial [Dehalococcoidia bacterium]|nr:3-hydroxyacyl-CoA dehydrogenase family protein [Dehalococcoidia bacterium]
GHGIAQVFALGGYRVTLNDLDETILGNALDRLKGNLGTFAENGLISQDEIPDTLSRIALVTDLREAVCDADFVVEAVIEDIEVKRELFNQLDVLCPPRTILTSNSSSHLITDFASATKRQDKVVLTHWFNPPHIVPTVEIIKGHRTSDETVDLVYALLKKVRKLPVKITKEIPGYLVNRIQLAMAREVWHLWEQGVASAEVIDIAVKGSFGFRLASIGPLLTNDLGGNDTNYAVAKYLFPLINDSHQPPPAFARMVQAGNLGAKAGKGFFDYSKEEWNRIVKKRDQEFLQRLKALYWSE